MQFEGSATMGVGFTIDIDQALVNLDIVGQRVEQVTATSVNRFERMEDASRRAVDTKPAVESLANLTGAVTKHADYRAEQERLNVEQERAARSNRTDAQKRRDDALFATRTATMQVGLYGDMAEAAQGFFKRGSDGWKVMGTATKAYRAIELALAVEGAARQIGLIGATTVAKVASDTTMAASDTARSAVEQGNSVAATATKAVEAVVNAIRSLPFPANIAAGAATAAAIAALGVAAVGGFGGGGNTLPKANEGKGTVLGDSDAQSASIKNAIEALRDVDTVTMQHSARMAASLKAIETNIGGLSSLIVRTGDVNASAGTATGFKADAIGSVLGSVPVIGGVLKSLFGTSTKIVGSGLYGGAQSLGDVLSDGYDASYYSDVQRKKKLFGLTTSTKYATQYSGASDELESQFTLILRNFSDAIGAAAEPLGQATDTVAQRLNRFVVSIGKVDLQGLSGEEIQERLTAVFGAAADDMARAALPGLEAYQKVGEGYFETATRVASTVETVSASLDMLGKGAQGIGVGASMGLASLFDSVGDLQSATSAYFETYYTEAEQAEARTRQMAGAFTSLGVSMPDSISGFRALVEAQDLTTAAGRETYATLLKLAPAFAEANAAFQDATSAASILRERQDLTRQIMELEGDQAGLRALERERVANDNRSLFDRVNLLKDEQAATQAANAIADRREQLERQLLQLNGDTAEIRRRELADLPEQVRATQLLIYARQDEQAAATAAAQASERLATERRNIEDQILQAQGNTAEIRRRQLEATAPENRAELQRLWAIQDAQAAATKAAEAERERQQEAEQATRVAEQLRDAWRGVGDTLLEEVKRIRGLFDTTGAMGYATLLGQFNTATTAARGGDQDAAKSLTDISRQLLDAAADTATSQQELDRIRKVTANSLEDTYKLIMAASGNAAKAATSFGPMVPLPSNDNAAAWQTAVLATPSTPNNDMAVELRALRTQLADMQANMVNLMEQLLSVTGRGTDVLEMVQKQGEGEGLAVKVAA
ncbi:hypothetical protein [uncultured Sphingomonas sp.]|uniref:hypothetical protein n=1 Tax=uncultured Sphingomonas sp. TaxID=158754 RepID=UPI0025ED51B3|nr:hypothetical protein [uncultured Sphingomonas sp.]